MQTTMEAVVAVAMTGGTTMEEEVEDMAGTTMVRMFVRHVGEKCLLMSHARGLILITLRWIR